MKRLLILAALTLAASAHAQTWPAKPVRFIVPFPPGGSMPEIPTLHESGLAGFDTTQWLGILAPRGTPAEVISKVQTETAKALALPEVKARLAQAALQVVGSTPQEFEALIRSDLERWTAIAKELRLEPQ